MVFSVDYQEASFQRPPLKYEAGTPPIAQAIGLASAINYIQKKINFDLLKTYEANLCATLIDTLKDIKQVRILGPIEQLRESGHIVSFTANNMHPHDIAAYLDSKNIAVRAGHHCAQILHKKLNADGSVRVSFYGYNTLDEVKALCNELVILFS